MCVVSPLFPSLCGRRSTLLVVIHPFRQAEPCVHPFLPDRVAGRRKRRSVKRAHCDSADSRVAVSFPVQRAAAVRAEMKSNAIATVGVALVDLTLAVEPHLLFRKRRAEMEGRAGATLARLAMAQVNPIRIARGDDSKRATVALRGSFHRLPPRLVYAPLWPIFSSAVEPLRTERRLTSTTESQRHAPSDFHPQRSAGQDFALCNLKGSITTL